MIFIQPSINPVVMSLGFIDIRWYSLAYIFAFILGSFIIKKLNSGSYRLISNDKIDKFKDKHLDKYNVLIENGFIKDKVIKDEVIKDNN